MGTTRKLAIKAYQEAHPQPKVQKEVKSVVSGSFFGTSVAYAAAALSTISGAAAQNITLAPSTLDFAATAAPQDLSPAIIIGVASGVAIVAVGAAFVGYRVIRACGTGHRVAPLNDVIIANNPANNPLWVGSDVAIELEAPGINPKAPVVLTGVKEAFI